MFKRLTLVVSFLVCALPVQAQEKDGPFGLYMGMPLSELGEKEETKSGNWRLKSVPNPHPFLSIYVATATENSGLCQILGSTEKMDDVDRASREFQTIKKQITSRYGEPLEIGDVAMWMDNSAVGEWFGLWGLSENELPSEKEVSSAMAEKNIQSIAVKRHEIEGYPESSWRVGTVFIFSNEQDCQIIEGVDNPF